MKNSTNKILAIAVVLLLLANIAMVIYIVKQRKHTDPAPTRASALEKMDKELGFTEQQKNEIKKLREDHFVKIRALFDTLRAAKSVFFALVKDQHVSDSTLAVYDKHITETQASIDRMTFAHFKSVRVLLDSGQQIKYDDFIQKMTQRVGRRRDSTQTKK